MFHINDYFTRLPGSYLFAEIARRVKAYSAAHPDAVNAVAILPEPKTEPSVAIVAKPAALEPDPVSALM